jgi:hypothetical protein
MKNVPRKAAVVTGVLPPSLDASVLPKPGHFMRLAVRLSLKPYRAVAPTLATGKDGSIAADPPGNTKERLTAAVTVASAKDVANAFILCLTDSDECLNGAKVGTIGTGGKVAGSTAGSKQHGPPHGATAFAGGAASELDEASTFWVIAFSVDDIRRYALDASSDTAVSVATHRQDAVVGDASMEGAKAARSKKLRPGARYRLTLKLAPGWICDVAGRPFRLTTSHLYSLVDEEPLSPLSGIAVGTPVNEKVDEKVDEKVNEKETKESFADDRFRDVSSDVSRDVSSSDPRGKAPLDESGVIMRRAPSREPPAPKREHHPASSHHSLDTHGTDVGSARPPQGASHDDDIGVTYSSLSATMWWALRLLLSGLLIIGILSGTIIYYQHRKARQRTAYAAVTVNTNRGRRSEEPSLVQRGMLWLAGTQVRRNSNWQDEYGGDEDNSLARLTDDEDLLGLGDASLSGAVEMGGASHGPRNGGGGARGSVGNCPDGPGGANGASSKNDAKLRDVLGINQWKQEEESRRHADLLRGEMEEARKERQATMRDTYGDDDDSGDCSDGSDEEEEDGEDERGHGNDASQSNVRRGRQRGKRGQKEQRGLGASPADVSLDHRGAYGGMIALTELARGGD